MHHGTFCSSESQCDQALRSDRTATSLSITAHRRCAVPGTVQGEDGGDGWECAWGGGGGGGVKKKKKRKTKQGSATDRYDQIK